MNIHGNEEPTLVRGQLMVSDCGKLVVYSISERKYYIFNCIGKTDGEIRLKYREEFVDKKLNW